MNSTRDILYEWREFLRNDLLSEVKASEFFQDKSIIDKIGLEAFEKNVYNRRKNKWIKPFNDNDYAQILYNSLSAGEEVDIKKVIDNFGEVKEKILNPFNSTGGPIEAEGDRKTITISSLKDLTFSKCNEYIQIKKVGSLRTSSYIKCLAQDYINKDFELVGKTSKYLIFYPKTTIGSISLARSYYDLRAKKLVYDTSFVEGDRYGDKIGEMEWCTSISGSINYFNNYHVNQNIHMYYFIQINYDIDDSTRKLCVGLSKRNGEVAISNLRDVFVDGNNNTLNKEDLEYFIGKDGISILFNDAKKDERKEITSEEYYGQKTLSDYIELRRQNDASPDDIAQDVSSILKYSIEKRKIANYICEHDDNVSLIRVACESGLVDSKYHEKLLHYLGDSQAITRSILIQTDNINVINKAMNTGTVRAKKYISSNKNAPLDILTELSKEETYFVDLAKNESINIEIFKTIISSNAANYGNAIKSNLFLNKSVPLSWKESFARTATPNILLEILMTADGTDKKINENILIMLLDKYKSNRDITKFILSNKGLSADNFIKYGDNILGATAVISRTDIHADLAIDDMTRSVYILSNIAEYTKDINVIDHIVETKKEVTILFHLLANRRCQERHRIKIVDLCTKRKRTYEVLKSEKYLELLRITASASPNPDTIDRIARVKGLNDLTYRTIISNRATSVDTLKHVLTVCSKKLKRDVEIAISEKQ
jgi:hypothetical protein